MQATLTRIQVPHTTLLELYGKYIERFVNAALEDESTNNKQQVPLSFTEWLTKEFNNPEGEYAGYTQIEYDLNYYGGDYSAVGEFALIPRWLIQYFLEFGSKEPERKAFKSMMGISPQHIIHFCPDEVYDANGEIIF